MASEGPLGGDGDAEPHRQTVGRGGPPRWRHAEGGHMRERAPLRESVARQRCERHSQRWWGRMGDGTRRREASEVLGGRQVAVIEAGRCGRSLCSRGRPRLEPTSWLCSGRRKWWLRKALSWQQQTCSHIHDGRQRSCLRFYTASRCWRPATMVESAIAQRKRRQKRRKEREKSGQQVPKRGRRAVDTAAATIEVDVHALHMNVAAGTTLAFGIAKHLAAQVSTARATLKHHKLQLAELQYRFWVDGKGVVQQRLVDTQRLLLRTEHVKTFANLARKVYSKGGVAITCLALNGLITGNGASVAVTKELLSVVGDCVCDGVLERFVMTTGRPPRWSDLLSHADQPGCVCATDVVRGRLMQLRFVMMNGQCPEVCRSEDSTAIQPLCDQLVDLARRCESVGRPLIGVNWAEVEWSTPAARTFAAALVDAKIVKFQVSLD